MSLLAGVTWVIYIVVLREIWGIIDKRISAERHRRLARHRRLLKVVYATVAVGTGTIVMWNYLLHF